MPWEVTFYEPLPGKRPAEEFICSLKFREQAKLIGSLMILEEFGPHIGMPYVRYLNNDLWELRTPFGGQSFRVFFFIDANKLVALHAIVKKSAKTPSRDLDTAMARMKEYKQRKDVAK